MPVLDREKCVHCGARIWNCAQPLPDNLNARHRLPRRHRRAARSCDAPSQKGAGDALVAGLAKTQPSDAVKERDEGVASTLWRRGVAATFTAPQLHDYGFSRVLMSGAP